MPNAEGRFSPRLRGVLSILFIYHRSVAVRKESETSSLRGWPTDNRKACVFWSGPTVWFLKRFPPSVCRNRWRKLAKVALLLTPNGVQQGQLWDRLLAAYWSTRDLHLRKALLALEKDAFCFACSARLSRKHTLAPKPLP